MATPAGDILAPRAVTQALAVRPAIRAAVVTRVRLQERVAILAPRVLPLRAVADIPAEDSQVVASPVVVSPAAAFPVVASVLAGRWAWAALVRRAATIRSIARTSTLSARSR